MKDLDYVVFSLAGLYFILVIFPAMQLIRIHMRVPDLGWTTQKLFLFLTLLSSLVRTVFFIVVPWLHDNVFFMAQFAKHPAFTILDQLPAVLFFSTYTLLILFWAEIIHHARNQSISFPQKLRPIFMSINMVLYLVLIAFWLVLFIFNSQQKYIDDALNGFLASIFLFAAFGFILYGGRLYVMLKQFPIESRGRRSKLKEVGWVSVICTTCFTLRAALLIYSTISQKIDARFWFVGAYYVVVEVLPSSLVLFILRKLPPKREDKTPHGPYGYTKVNPTQFERYDRYDSENYRINLDANNINTTS